MQTILQNTFLTSCRQHCNSALKYRIQTFKSMKLWIECCTMANSRVNDSDVSFSDDGQTRVSDRSSLRGLFTMSLQTLSRGTKPQEAKLSLFKRSMFVRTKYCNLMDYKKVWMLTAAISNKSWTCSCKSQKFLPMSLKEHHHNIITLFIIRNFCQAL